MPVAEPPTVEKKVEHDWQTEHIASFWDWCSRSPLRQRSYFTAQVGSGICEFLQRHVPLQGRLLDFGCGAGHLLDVLLQKSDGLEGYGLEFSCKSAEATEQRLAGKSNWRGVRCAEELPAPFPADHFQIITLIETIEHLKEDALYATLGELHRLLAPGGRLLITTPFEENLEANMVYCPFCSSEFHRMQHMRSFSIDGLRRLVEEMQFQVAYCRNINFRHYGGGRNWLVGAKDGAKNRLKALLRMRVAPPPHLVALATK